MKPNGLYGTAVPTWHFALLAFCLLLAGVTGASGRPQDPTSKQDTRVKVAVTPFVIEPQPFAGTPSRQDQEKFVQHLSDEATKQAAQSMTEHRIVDSVQQVPSRDAAKGQVVVTGVVRLPVSLPSGVIGWSGSHRHGHFATATVTVFSPVGQIISTEDVTVDWGDVWWFKSGKSARNYPQDEVIASLVRKAVDHAVRRLDRQKLMSPLLDNAAEKA